MTGLHSQSGPKVVYNKGVILPRGITSFSQMLMIIPKKIWINNEQLYHYCIMLDVYARCV